jgi:phosphonate transport system substrate-binding protein
MLFQKKAKIALVIFSIIFVSICASIAHAQESLNLRIHPYLPATELIEMFSPLAEYLSESTGYQINITISKDYKNHIERVGKDKTDLAYMGPASYVKMVDIYGKKPLLARLEINGDPTFQGVIIVNKKSTFQSMSDLAGKRFAFGDPNSTMSHLVPRYMLWKAGVDVRDLADYAFLKNHENVALGVLVGDFDAGAVKEAVFYKYRDRGLKKLKKTPSISEHVFVTRKTLSPKIINKLNTALQELRNTEGGHEIMSSIKPDLSGMAKAKDSDYNNLRIILRQLEKMGVQ